MKMLRKAIALLAALLLALSFVACGKQKTTEPLDETAQWLLQNVSEPSFGPTGGEWTVLGLSRWEGQVPAGYLEGYYDRLCMEVTEMNGVLHEVKYTEYSRVVLALTAMGKDPYDLAGFDLLAPLKDLEKTVRQGPNGAAYALLALDSCNSADEEIPRAYVDWLLSQEIPGGGWGLTAGSADGDITAMVLQALAKHQSREDVAQAIDRALVLMSGLCLSGEVADRGECSCESICQVIVALTELGISLDDERFTLDGKTLGDMLQSYRMEDGSFRHTLQSQKCNLMATEQAFYTMVAIDRMEQGKSSLYDMK